MPWTQVGQRIAGQPAAVQWRDTADGRVVVSVFARLPETNGLGYVELHVEGSRAEDRRLVVREPSGTWQPLPEIVRGDPAVLPSTSPALRVFVRGTDDRLWLRWSNGTSWFGAEPTGDLTFTSAISAVEDELGLIHVFVRGQEGGSTRGSVMVGAQPTPIERVPDLRWASIGGDVRGNPKAIAFPRIRMLHVYVRGLDDVLWRNVRAAGAWSGWQRLGVPLAGDPAPAPAPHAQSGTDWVYVAGRGPDGRVRCWRAPASNASGTGQGVATSDASELVEAPFGNPAAATRSGGEVVVAATSTATGDVKWSWTMPTNVADRPFDAWAPLDGRLPFDPVMAGNLGMLHVLAKDRDGTLWHRWHDGRDWR